MSKWAKGFSDWSRINRGNFGGGRISNLTLNGRWRYISRCCMKAIWSDEKVLAKVREMVLPAIQRDGPIEAWIIDDTGFPKKGRHSVGVRGNIVASLAGKTIVRSP